MGTQQNDEFRLVGRREQSRMVNKYLASVTFEALSHKARIDFYQYAFMLSARNHDDEATLEILELMAAAYVEKVTAERTPQDGKGSVMPREIYDCARTEHLTYLTSVFWNLPTSQMGHRDEIQCSLVKTRLKILDLLMQGWCVDDTSEENVARLHFLQDAYGSRWGKKKHCIASGEQESILGILSHRLLCRKEAWSVGQQQVPLSDLLTFWLRLDGLSENFYDVFLWQRAKDGRRELALRDIQSTELLQKFQLEKRTPQARKLLEILSEDVRRHDESVAGLLKQMQPKESFWVSKEDRTVGASECVVGKIKIVELDLSLLHLDIELESDCSHELGMCILGRARRHIENWQRSHSVDVMLCVLGGVAHLKEEWRFPSIDSQKQ